MNKQNGKAKLDELDKLDDNMEKRNKMLDEALASMREGIMEFRIALDFMRKSNGKGKLTDDRT